MNGDMTGAAYLTIGGALVRITSGTDADLIGRPVYGWRCEGCRADRPADYGWARWAQEAASEHAAVCRAVSPRVLSGESELAAVREALSELVTAVQALQAAPEPRRSRRPRWIGGGR